MRRPAWPALAVLLLLLLAGCGNSRTSVPSLTQPRAPGGFHALGVPQAGVVFDAPRDWTVSSGRPPLMATVSSGPAIVAIWRYQRSGPARMAPPQLRHAERALIRAARIRDPGLEVLHTILGTVDGAPAIVLSALESVGGQLRRVRSIHVFVRRAELVIDEYAPPSVFASVDQQVFSPLARSLRLFA